VAALLGLGPVFGAIVGEAVGAYDGTVFAMFCVASAAVAGVIARPAALWWVVPMSPPLVWAVSILTELAWHDPPYRGPKQRVVGVAHGTIHAFPVMAAVGLALAVVAVVRVSGELRKGAARV
jgi:hypothetical protein